MRLKQRSIVFQYTLPWNLDSKFHWFSMRKQHVRRVIAPLQWLSYNWWLEIDCKRFWNLLCKFSKGTSVTRSTEKPPNADTASNAGTRNYWRNIFTNVDGEISSRSAAVSAIWEILVPSLQSVLTDCILSLISLALMSSNSNWIKMIAVLPKADQQ